MHEFKVPGLGENIDDAEVLKVLVKEGDRVEAEQAVLELETDKAAFELPADRAGVVKDIRVKEGDTVKIGQTVMAIEEGEAPAKEEKKKEEEEAEPEEKGEKEPEEEEEPKPEPERPREERREERKEPKKTEPATAAAPSTRRLARELGVDLAKIRGTEDGGRITKEDVKAHARALLERGVSAPAPPPLPEFEKYGRVERRPLTRLRKTASERLSLAWRTIPHVTQHDLADVTELERARRRYQENREEHDPKLTITALAIRASVALLKEHPQFNASLDEAAGEIVLKRHYHIGIAVDTERGLLVPVLRDADKKTTREIASELDRLAERAREKKLLVDEMRGSTFTVTNLGGIGGTYFTPIIQHPEVAILGLSRAAEDHAGRLMLPLSLSYDHRVIDGADAARFTRRLARLLADPLHLLMDS